MKKLVTLATMLGIVLAVAIPATAQILPESNVEQDAPETGDVSLSGSITSTGNNSSQCVMPMQFGNTGQPQDRFDFLQYASRADDIKADSGSASLTQFASQADDIQVGGGSPMTFEPSQEGSCTQ